MTFVCLFWVGGRRRSGKQRWRSGGSTRLLQFHLPSSQASLFGQAKIVKLLDCCSLLPIPSRTPCFLSPGISAFKMAVGTDKTMWMSFSRSFRRRMQRRLGMNKISFLYFIGWDFSKEMLRNKRCMNDDNFRVTKKTSLVQSDNVNY